MERRKKGSGQVTYVDEETRKKKWKATIRINGKAKTKYFKTEAEAEKYLKGISSDNKKLHDLIDAGVRLSDFAPVFVKEKEKAGMKPTSFASLCGYVDRSVSYLGTMKMRDIDSDVIQNMVNDLREEGYSKTVMLKTAQHTCAMLKMAAAKHLIEVLPVFNYTVPETKKQQADRDAKNNWLRADEMKLYQAECTRTYVPQKYTKYAGKTLMSHPSGYKLLLILHTGLRLGEALALTWDKFSEQSKTLLIDSNLVYVDGEKIVQNSTKTASGERVIVLNKAAYEDIRQLKLQFDNQTKEIDEREREELEAAKRKYSATELRTAKKQIAEKYTAIRSNHKYICGASAFPFGIGCASSIDQTHRKICKAIGLKHKVTVHGLRHTYVTHYYLHHKNDADFDLATFSKSIGHSSIRTTLEIYAHLDMVENRYIVRTAQELKDF